MSALVGDIRNINTPTIYARQKSVIGGTTDDVRTPFQAMLTASGAYANIDLEGKTYLITDEVIPLVGQTIDNGRIELHPSAHVAGARRLIRAVNKLTLGRRLTWSDGRQMVAGCWVTGVENVEAIADWIEILGNTDGISFKGVNIHDNLGAWANGVVTIGGEHVDCGWEPVATQGARRVLLRTPQISRFGFNGFNQIRAKEVIGTRTIDKSGSPHRVYNGAGSFGGDEGGGCIVTLDAVIRLGRDIIKGKATDSPGDLLVMSERGRPTLQARSICEYVVSDTDLGGGIDIESGMQATADISNCAVGFLVTRDLGGDIEDFSCRGRFNGSDVGLHGIVFHPCREDITRTCTVVSGQSNITITGSGLSYLAPGLRISGTGIPAGTVIGPTYNVDAQSTTIPMVKKSDGTPQTATLSNTGVTVTFEGYTVWRRGVVDMTVENAQYAARFYDCSDDPDYGYEDVHARIRAKNISEANVVDFFPGGVHPPGLTLDITVDGKRTISTSGSAPSVRIHKSLSHNGGGTINRLLHGQPGDKVVLYFNASATINVDWTNAGGWGTDRIVGNENVDLNVDAGDAVFFEKLEDPNGAGMAWYITSHVKVA